MLNIITVESYENPETKKTEKIVSGIKMVGDTVVMSDNDYSIKEYNVYLVGCEVVNGDIINEDGEVLYSLNLE